MDDAAGVGVLQRGADLLAEPDHFFPLEPAAAREIGSLAARVPVSERDPERHVRDVARQLPDASWPERLRSRALQLQQNGVYAIVQLFDGLQLDTLYITSADGAGLFAATPGVKGLAESRFG